MKYNICYWYSKCDQNYSLCDNSQVDLLLNDMTYVMFILIWLKKYSLITHLNVSFFYSLYTISITT